MRREMSLYFACFYSLVTHFTKSALPPPGPEILYEGKCLNLPVAMGNDAIEGDVVKRIGHDRFYPPLTYIHPRTFPRFEGL
jgi:hypothetical protein